MSLDDELYDLLGDQSEQGAASGRPERRWDPSRREAAARMLDATAGVLAATGRLIAVAEELVQDQRDRLATEPPARGGAPRAASPHNPPASGRRRIDLTY